MKLSALTSSLPMELPVAVGTIADLGFRCVDLPPTKDPAVLQTLESRELQVTCVGLERDQPGQLDLASSDASTRTRAVEYFRGAIGQTARLGSPAGYLTPPRAADEATVQRWTESLVALADCARQEGVRLCLEHFPGRALPTVASTLAFLDHLQHEALAILIDVGHCLISREDPAEAIRQSGPRLGYLHFDDNDGVSDLHWALLDGQLTQGQLTAALAAQRASGYDGALCIELNHQLDQPIENLRRSREIMLRCAD